MGNTYTAFREQGLPTYYPPNKTAVTADVLEIGFIFAFVIAFFSFIVILPGIRGMQVRVPHIEIDNELKELAMTLCHIINLILE